MMINELNTSVDPTPNRVLERAGLASVKAVYSNSSSDVNQRYETCLWLAAHEALLHIILEKRNMYEALKATPGFGDIRHALLVAYAKKQGECPNSAVVQVEMFDIIDRIEAAARAELTNVLFNKDYGSP